MTLNTLNEHAQRELTRLSESLERVLRAFSQVRVTAQPELIESVESRVTCGIAFLDDRLGREFWLERIDVTTLDVWSISDCVVCQVTGLSYSDGLQVLGAPGSYGTLTRARWADAHGFSDDVSDDGIHRYSELTTAWSTRVRQLRAETDSVRITK